MTSPLTTDDSAASKCVECGAAISSKAKFCSECGALLVASNSSPKQLGEALSETKGRDEESSNIESESPVGIEPPRFGHEETVAEKQDARVVIAGAVLLLITIVALLFTHHSKNPQSNPSAQSPEVVPQTGTASSFKESMHRLTPDTLSRVHALLNTKSPEWPLLLTLPEISQATERAFGGKASSFRECGTGSATLVGNLLAIQICKSHACPDLGGILIVNIDTGDAAGAMYDTTGTTIYVGDYKDPARTPSAIQDWVRDYRHGDSVRYQTGSSRMDASETPSSRLSSLITSNKEFAICRVRELEFGRDPMQDTGQCKLQDPFVWGTNSCNPYVSENEYGRELESLNKSGYIKIVTYPNRDSNPYSEYVWVPTSRGRAALNSDIREQKSAEYRNGRLASKWEIVLGCRGLQQIDATSPLSDGVKADFSWHWMTTELGTVEGLSESRQRGVAYFTRTSNGLNIDQIQFGSENVP